MEIEYFSGEVNGVNCTAEDKDNGFYYFECTFDVPDGYWTSQQVDQGRCSKNTIVPGDYGMVISINKSPYFNKGGFETTYPTNISKPIDYCLRLDLWTNYNEEDISVGAFLYNVTTSFTVGKKGTFNTTIESDDYGLSVKESNAVGELAAVVDAYICDTEGFPFEGVISIGSILNICVSTPGATVTVTNLIIVHEGETLATPVQESANGFLTTTDTKKYQGISTAIVSTLMLPNIFDVAKGEALYISGTVDIEDRRILKKTSRALQVAEEANPEFVLKFYLSETEVTGLIQRGSASRANDSRVGVMIVLAAGLIRFLG